MTLQIGDKVRVKTRYRMSKGDIGTIVKDRGDGVWDVKGDGWASGGSSVTPGAGTYSTDKLEKIEEPAFRVGDRVRLPGWVHTAKTGTVVALTGDPGFVEVMPDGGRKWSKGCAVTVEGAATLSTESLVKIPQGVPFKLERGDKVVNRKTGREGRVLFGPVSKELKVYDVKPSIQAPDAPPAKALEEYEFHFPGTYDLFKAKGNPWQ